MKTFKTTLLTACMIVFAYSLSKADPKPDGTKSINTVIQQYIDGVTLGQVQSIKNILGEHFRQNCNQNGKTVMYTKKQMIDFLNRTKNVQQNCTTSFDIVEKSEHCSIIKVEMRYPTFTKVDYVTLCQDDTQWKVNQVVTTYP